MKIFAAGKEKAEAVPLKGDRNGDAAAFSL